MLWSRTEERTLVAAGDVQVVAVAATVRVVLRIGTWAVAWQRRAPARIEVAGSDRRVIRLRIPDATAWLRLAAAGWLAWQWLRRPG